MNAQAQSEMHACPSTRTAADASGTPQRGSTGRPCVVTFGRCRQQAKHRGWMRTFSREKKKMERFWQIKLLSFFSCI